MPVEQLWRYTALASSYTGISDCGLKWGLTSMQEHSEFGPDILWSQTLCQAINRFCKTARAYLSPVDYEIQQKAV